MSLEALVACVTSDYFGSSHLSLFTPKDRERPEAVEGAARADLVGGSLHHHLPFARLEKGDELSRPRLSSKVSGLE